MAFVHFFCTLLLTMSSVVDLYVYMGATSCGWTIYSSLILVGLTDLVLCNKALIYACASDDITYFIMLERVRTFLLVYWVLLKCFDPMKNAPPARIPARSSDR